MFLLKRYVHIAQRTGGGELFRVLETEEVGVSPARWSTFILVDIQCLFSKYKINFCLENRRKDNLKELGVDGNY